MSSYDYQYGYCHYFAKNVIGELRATYPNKQINHFLLLVDEVDVDTEDIVYEHLIHVYVKIDDIYIDSEGFITYEKVMERVDNWLQIQREVVPHHHRLDVWLMEDTEIPKHFFDDQTCDEDMVKKDVHTFKNGNTFNINGYQF